MGTQLEVIRKKIAERTKIYTDAEKSGRSYISTAGGELSLNDDVFPGNRMLAIILDAVHMNVFYTNAYSKKATTPPTCFAIGRGQKDMGPSEELDDSDYFEPQDYECRSCSKFIFGTSDTGKGKACKEKRRLIVVPAGYFKAVGSGRNASFEEVLYTDEDHFRKTDMAILDVPVTSVKKFAKYVLDLGRKYELPPLGVITEIWTEPDAASSFSVNFDVVGTVEEHLGQDFLEILFNRCDEAEDIAFEGFKEPLVD